MKKIGTYSISFREPTLAYALPEVGYLQKESLALRSGLTPAAVVEQHPATGISCGSVPNLSNQEKVYLTSTKSTYPAQKAFCLKDSVIFCSAFAVTSENFINRETNLVLRR